MGDLPGLWQVAGALLAAGAVYGGIRNDLKNMHARQDRHERSIDRLHERLDGCGECRSRASD